MGCQASSVLAKEAPLPQYNNETALALLKPKERKAAINAVDGALIPTVNEADDIDADFDLNTLQRRPPQWLIMVDRSDKDLSALSTSTQSTLSDPTALEATAGYSVERASVKSVINGNTFVLYDGRIVRLAGVAVPLKGEPYYKKAKRLLEHFTLGQWIYLEKEADVSIPDFEFAAPLAETFRENVTRKFKTRRSARRIAKRNKATQNMLQREESQRLAMLEIQRQRHGGSIPSKEPSGSPTRRRPPPREGEESDHEPSSPLKRHRAQQGFEAADNDNTQPATVSARTVSNRSSSPTIQAMPEKPSKHKRSGSAPAESSSASPLPPIVYLRTAYTIVNGEKGYMNLNAAVVAYGFGTVLLEDGSNGHEVPHWMQVAAAKKVREESEIKRADYATRAMQQSNVLPTRKQQGNGFHVPELRSPIDPTQTNHQQVLLVSPSHSPNAIDPARPPYSYPSNRALMLDCIRNAIVFPLGRWVAEEQLLAKVCIPINESTDRKYMHHKGCPSLSGAVEIKTTTLRRALVMGRSPCPKCKTSINNDCKHLSERKAEKERAEQEKERDRRAKFKQTLLDEYEEKRKEMQLERQKELERRNTTVGGHTDNNDDKPTA